MMTRLTALACFLVSMQAMGGNRLGDLTKALVQLQSASINAENGNPLLNETLGKLNAGQSEGQASDATPNIMSLLTGGGAVNAPKPVEAPAKPNTLIRYMPPDKEGESGKAESLEVPADARMIVVDGRVQISYPKGKPGKGR